MACSGECWELGPPPDSILRMPPPPLPAFLQRAVPAGNLSSLPGAGGCRPAGLCDPPAPPPGGVFPGVEYVELPHHDSSTADDTWFLVLITSCVAVLFLGAMLALFLLKCREYVCSLPMSYTFHFSESNANKQGPLSSELAGPLQAKTRPTAPVNGNLYPPGPTPPDNRALWAALTPRGTQHFIADIYPQDCVSSDPYPEDNHYETVEAMNYKSAIHDKLSYPMQISHFDKLQDKASFDNSGFMDYEYEDPAPLIESYQMDDMETCYQEPDVNPYCIVNQYPHESLGTMKRGSSRPRVSSPTRIENPNLPPLNLYPHRPGGTLRKPSHSRRVSDSNSYNGNMNI